MVVEHRGLAEEDILRAGVISLLYRCHTVEPHDLDGARSVGKQGLQASLASLASRRESEEAPPQLDCSLVTVELIHVVDHATIDIAEREIVKQVVIGLDTQLLAEELSPLWSHTVQVLYVGVAQVRHGSAGIRQAPSPWDE